MDGDFDEADLPEELREAELTAAAVDLHPTVSVATPLGLQQTTSVVTPAQPYFGATSPASPAGFVQPPRGGAPSASPRSAYRQPGRQATLLSATSSAMSAAVTGSHDGPVGTSSYQLAPVGLAFSSSYDTTSSEIEEDSTPRGTGGDWSVDRTASDAPQQETGELESSLRRQSSLLGSGSVGTSGQIRRHSHRAVRFKRSVRPPTRRPLPRNSLLTVLSSRSTGKTSRTLTVPRRLHRAASGQRWHKPLRRRPSRGMYPG